MATLDTGDGSPTAIVSGVTSYLGSGGQTGTLFLGGLFGVVVSVFTGGVNIAQSIFGALAGFVDGIGRVAVTSLEATILSPLGIIEAGAQASAQAVASYRIAGILVAVGLVLAVFFLITQYLEEPETSDSTIIPGFPDLPLFGVEEEGEE
ncbi:hypothetical protein DVK02_12870 [Halobellus sp. Atlit-31R]|nr:hypothetical protein DVK02_12870 [Halobellus sp. Atlit-31R]